MEVVIADLNKVKEIVEMIGLKAEEINDDIVEKVDAYKPKGRGTSTQFTKTEWLLRQKPR